MVSVMVLMLRRYKEKRKFNACIFEKFSYFQQLMHVIANKGITLISLPFHFAGFEAAF